MSTTSVSPLRQRMIEDTSLRNLAPRTQQAYIRGCKKLAAFLRRSPDTATAEDIRLFQLDLAKRERSAVDDADQKPPLQPGDLWPFLREMAPIPHGRSQRQSGSRDRCIEGHWRGDRLALSTSRCCRGRQLRVEQE